MATKDSTQATWRSYVNPELFNPELLQPTIIAISATYILYLIGALYLFTPNLPAETQFSYYVASLGLISGLLFYARFISSWPPYVSFMDLAHMVLCCILTAVYIMYWFIPVDFSKVDVIKENATFIRQPQVNFYLNKQYDVSQYRAAAQKPAKFDTSNCFDTRKCSHPVHLVLQSAFMICIVVSLVFSSIRRG